MLFQRKKPSLKPAVTIRRVGLITPCAMVSDEQILLFTPVLGLKPAKYLQTKEGFKILDPTGRHSIMLDIPPNASLGMATGTPTSIVEINDSGVSRTSSLAKLKN
jgi:hypothetical protein